MRTKPTLSIGMPVYNAAALLPQALDSILAQTFEDFELIICDNASTDATDDIARHYAVRDKRIRYYRNPANLGAARNFNKSFHLSRGAYFKWAAHDDLLAKTFLQRCIELMQSAPPSVVITFARRQLLNPDGSFYTAPGYDPNRSYHNYTFRQFLRLPGPDFPIFQFGIMRPQAMRKTRLFQNWFPADQLFVEEMALLGELWEVPEVLFFQRLHAPTPEWLLRRTRRGESVWFDPANQNRRIYPGLKLFTEQITSVCTLPMPREQRIRRFWDMAAYSGAKTSRLIFSGRLFRRITQEFRWAREPVAPVQPNPHESTVQISPLCPTAPLRHTGSRH